jgi:hypothetical protein
MNKLDKRDAFMMHDHIKKMSLNGNLSIHDSLKIIGVDNTTYTKKLFTKDQFRNFLDLYLRVNCDRNNEKPIKFTENYFKYSVKEEFNKSANFI